MNFEVKTKLLSLFIFFALGLIFVRLSYWQIVRSHGLSAAAESQHFDFLEIPARRGEIQSSDGSPLASNRTAYLMYAHLPKITADKATIAKNLSELVAVQVPVVATTSSQITIAKNLEKYFTERLTLGGFGWVNLFHFVNKPIKEQISSLNISGIGFETEETRDYPESSMAAHLLGLVGSDKNGNPKGYFGLEGYYQLELAGKNGEIRREKDAFGRPIAIGSEYRQEKQDGSDIQTTIDRGVQHFTEGNLEKGISDWKASGGSAVVMNAKTGAILALANFPLYDPGNFSYYPTSTYKNPAIADLFEPGSIIKPLVVAAALNENKIDSETRCSTCDGPKQVYNFYIHTFDNRYHPNSTMTEVLINSDNTGMVFIGEKLGFTKLYSYMERFGFGKKTGVDLQEEEEGTFRRVNDYYPIDQATMTFGQGISVNPLQMVRAYGALANNGFLPTPYLVSKIKNSGQTVTLAPKQGPRVISDSTSKIITEMLVQVADKSPVHFPKDRIPELANFRIAAKSGTAQIALGGKYKSTGTIASVIGYFPADLPAGRQGDPKFVIYVKLNEPEVRPWGSDTAGPVFFSIVKNLIEYYGISP